MQFDITYPYIVSSLFIDVSRNSRSLQQDDADFL